MNNKEITDNLLAQLEAHPDQRLTDADAKALHEREMHVSTTIADRQRQLDNVIATQQWFRDSRLATDQLEDATSHHANVNKQYLAMRTEEARLRRRDSLMEFRPIYDRIAERRSVVDEIKNEEAATAETIDQLRQQLAEAARQQLVSDERLADAQQQLAQQQKSIDAGYVTTGEINTLESDLLDAEAALTRAQRELGDSEAELRNRSSELAETRARLDELNLHHQSLAVHQQLFEQYLSVNDKLQRYNAESRINDGLHNDYTAASRKLQDLTARHDTTRQQLISSREKLDALHESLTTHREAINEQDSGQLYQRYTTARLRLGELQSARNAWKSITAGYRSLELQRATIERQARQLEQKRQEKEVADRDVRLLYERYTRLNKAFILLQIENTRKLREGLKEGTPCPVCGSAHHPYHTEVERELGETQTQLEKDFLAARDDYETRQQAAHEVASEVATAAGRLQAEREMLERMTEAQNNLVAGWERFKTLDPTFATAGESVNRGARATTIEMLIDSVDRLVKDYEQRIRRFDFHNQQLAAVAEQTQNAENAVEDQQAQYAQLDTERKLLQERVEHLHALVQESDARIESLYKDLDDVVTISGWREDNIAEFTKNLAELNNDWQVTVGNLNICEHQHELLRQREASASNRYARLQNYLNRQRENRDRIRELLSSKREDIRKVFGAGTPAELAAQLQQNVAEAQQQLSAAQQSHDELKKKIDAVAGHREGLAAQRTQQEATILELSTTLDHAIARYNLTHNVVQASELASIFADDRDWELLRQTVEECRDALLVAREQMEAAQRRFMDLEGDAARPDDPVTDTPEAFDQRHTALLLEIEQLRDELAGLRRVLRRHEGA